MRETLRSNKRGFGAASLFSLLIAVISASRSNTPLATFAEVALVVAVVAIAMLVLMSRSVPRSQGTR